MNASIVFPDNIKQQKNYKGLVSCFDKLPEIVQELVVKANAFMYLPKYRGIQKKYGDEIIIGMAKLAGQAKKSGHYFASITSKENLERTLDYVKRILARPVLQMNRIATKLGYKATKPRTFMNYVGDMIAKQKLSEADVTDMIERASKARHPDRYLVGILKKGYVRPKLTRFISTDDKPKLKTVLDF